MTTPGLVCSSRLSLSLSLFSFSIHQTELRVPRLFPTTRALLNLRLDRLGCAERERGSRRQTAAAHMMVREGSNVGRRMGFSSHSSYVAAQHAGSIDEALPNVSVTYETGCQSQTQGTRTVLYHGENHMAQGSIPYAQQKHLAQSDSPVFGTDSFRCNATNTVTYIYEYFCNKAYLLSPAEPSGVVWRSAKIINVCCLQ